MIDIDPFELSKFKSFGLIFDILIQDDLKNFFKCFDNKLVINKKDIPHKNWLSQISIWEKEFNIIDKSNSEEEKTNIDPYEFFEILAKKIATNTSLFIDTGCSIAWAMQAMRFKKGVRIFHDFNNTAMGWALPALIGGHFADESGDKLCIAGDGSFMMTMQELATVLHHKLKLKLIVITPSTSMIKQTQDQWLNSNYVASSQEGGLSFPIYKDVSKAFGLDYIELSQNSEIENKVNKFLISERPVMLNLKISETARVKPQLNLGDK